MRVYITRAFASLLIYRSETCVHRKRDFDERKNRSSGVPCEDKYTDISLTVEFLLHCSLAFSALFKLLLLHRAVRANQRQKMSNEEAMDDGSGPSQSSHTSARISSRLRSAGQRRVRSLNSPPGRSVSRLSTVKTSTPRSGRRPSELENQSLKIRSVSTVTDDDIRNDSDSLPSPVSRSDEARDSSQLQGSSLPFDASFDDEDSEHAAMDTTTPSGKMKKNVVLSFFTPRLDGRFECNMCHEVSHFQLCHFESRILKGRSFSLSFL